jgi:hypothetical protein
MSEIEKPTALSNSAKHFADDLGALHLVLGFFDEISNARCHRSFLLKRSGRSSLDRISAEGFELKTERKLRLTIVEEMHVYLYLKFSSLREADELFTSRVRWI